MQAEVIETILAAYWTLSYREPIFLSINSKEESMVAHKEEEAAIAKLSRKEYRLSLKTRRSAISEKPIADPQDYLARISDRFTCHFPPPNRMAAHRTNASA
jgi:hypothetical protein